MKFLHIGTFRTREARGFLFGARVRVLRTAKAVRGKRPVTRGFLTHRTTAKPARPSQPGRRAVASPREQNPPRCLRDE